MTQKKLEKLAVVLQSSSTGGWRYTCRLIQAIRRDRPQIAITVYLGRRLKSVGEEGSPRRVLEHFGVQVKAMPYLKSVEPGNLLRTSIHKLRKTLAYFQYRRWIKDLNLQDVVLFAWPFGIECPDIQVPIAFVPHDFNYTHFVGAFVETPRSTQSLYKQHRRWLSKAFPIVSSNFIAQDLKRAFPEFQGQPRVIPISHLGNLVGMDDFEAKKTVGSLGIQGDFILCLNNVSAHKNLGQLLAGYHYARQKFPELKMVLVGFGTEGICGNANTPWYLDNVQDGGNVASLGLRHDREVTALIKQAKLVINPSLYEAGNGSGLDAWMLGTPVAMSAIPSFLEHRVQLGVMAETFNPRCCYEIGEAICRIIDGPDKSKANAEASMLAMMRYTWSHVAASYLTAFEEIGAQGKPGEVRDAFGAA